MSDESNYDDSTEELTIPIEVIHDVLGGHASEQDHAIFQAWVESAAHASGPGATHVLEGKPTHPLPISMLAMLQEWDKKDKTELVERELLGEGGMAVVYLADQTIPPRQVAVKRLRENTVERAQNLFSEALLTGALEHPNIIPVHSIRVDPIKGPEVVLKRVEGISLSEAYSEDGASEAGLRRLLPKLLQVCNALEYAHARNIYHRDIKAENIMLGQYGEVYLLDWGIAIDKNAERGVNRGTVGTPHYIAPEMLSGEPDKVDARTDVYLLGATLHFLLTGEPRHNAPTTLSAAVMASQSKPAAYPGSVFPELGLLANRACALDPDDRPQTVSEFRHAVEDCLTHWDAMRTVQLAQPDFEFVMEAGATGSELADSVRHFDAAVLRFQVALSSWPDCKEAASRLTQVRLAMTRLYLDSNDSKAAKLLLNQVSAHTVADKRAVDALRRAVEQASQKESRVYEHAAANDISTSRTGRRRAAYAMLAVCAIAVAVTSYQQVSEKVSRTAGQGLGIWLIGTVIVVGVLFFNRRVMLENDAGRRAMLLLILAPILIAAIRTVVYIHGLNPALIHPIETFAIAHVCATSVEVFPRGPYFAIAGVGLGILGLLVPDVAYASFVTALLLACIGFVWQRLNWLK
ncbi:MAG: serine/threonine-protein kinase [Myxococcota bacterium]|nr:serine/threonine-protein kinase [Myxococcota bacterium]